jgi:hypothetical protein
MWRHHRTPWKYISDRGPQFIAEFTQELCHLIRIEPATSTACHPQTDGRAEHVNQELKQFVRIFTSYKHDDWDELLPAAEFAYNNHVHSSRQQVPFMTDTSRLPQMGFKPNGMRSADESINEFHNRIAAGVSEAKAVLVKAKDKFKLYYNCRCVPAPEIKVGDRVWVDVSDIKTTHSSPKFSDKQLRPFKVIQVVGKGAYKLELPPCYSQLHPVFPMVKLELAKPDPFPRHPRNNKPPPILQTDGDKRWEVNKILEARVRYGSLWYMRTWCAGKVMLRSMISG